MRRSRGVISSLSLTAVALACLTVCLPTAFASRVALIGRGGDAQKIVALSQVELGAQKNIVLLERDEVDKLLAEQELSLGPQTGASWVIAAGKVLHADIIGVVEADAEARLLPKPMNFIAFDARSGLRLRDVVLPKGTAAPAAVASQVTAALAKHIAPPERLRPVSLLSIRNVDLPIEGIQWAALSRRTLDRALSSTETLSMLERDRLEQINQERMLAGGDAAGQLLASTIFVEVDMSRHGDRQIKLKALLIDAAGRVIESPAMTVDIGQEATAFVNLATLIAKTIATTRPASPGKISLDARRFLTEAEHLASHGDVLPTIQAARAACALDPELTAASLRLAHAQILHAIGLLNPGHQGVSAGFFHLNEKAVAQSMAPSLESALAGAERLLASVRRLAREQGSEAAMSDKLANEARGGLSIYIGTLYRFQCFAVSPKVESSYGEFPVVLFREDLQTYESILKLSTQIRMEEEVMARQSVVDVPTFMRHTRILVGIFHSGTKMHFRKSDELLKLGPALLDHWLDNAERVLDPSWVTTERFEKLYNDPMVALVRLSVTGKYRILTGARTANDNRPRCVVDPAIQDTTGWPAERLRARIEKIPSLAKPVLQFVDYKPVVSTAPATRLASVPPWTQSSPPVPASSAVDTAAPLWKEALCLFDAKTDPDGAIAIANPVSHGQSLLLPLIVSHGPDAPHSMRLARIDAQTGKRELLGAVTGHERDTPRRTNNQPFDAGAFGTVTGDYFVLIGRGELKIFSLKDTWARRITFDDGYTSKGFISAAVLEGHLYTAHWEGFFYRLDLAREATANTSPAATRPVRAELIASSSRREPITELDNKKPFQVACMYADKPRHRLILYVFGEKWPVEECGLWEYVPGTGKFRFLDKAPKVDLSGFGRRDHSFVPISEDRLMVRHFGVGRFCDLTSNTLERHLVGRVVQSSNGPVTGAARESIETSDFRRLARVLNMSQVDGVIGKWFRVHGNSGDKTLVERIKPLGVIDGNPANSSLPRIREGIPNHPEWILLGNERRLWRLTVDPTVE